MKRRLGWRSITRARLAEHLQRAEIMASEALGDAVLYLCQGEDGESVAISLPGDVALIIDVQVEVPPSLERRRAQGENTPLDE